MNLKRFLLPVLAIVTMGLFAGCQKDVKMYTHEYVVSADQWVTQEGLNYYYASFKNMDITANVEEYGSVLAYVHDEGRWNPLPYVYPYYSAAEDRTWGENIRFDWTRDEVTFIVQDLDGGLPEGMNQFPTLTFKVNVLY